MSSPAPLIDVGELARQLSDRIEMLARTLAPGGRLEAGEYAALNPTRADRRIGSFRVCVRGPKRGIWCDFATGDKGDALDLVAYCACHGDKREAIRWARHWLGHDPGQAPAPAKSRSVQRAPAGGDSDHAAVELAERHKMRRAALGIWLSAKPIMDTPVDRYLHGRAIDLRALAAASGGHVPGALRYHPGLWHRASGRHWPAMVAVVCDGAGETIAVHRTWLEVRRDGSVGKAPVERPKMALGRYQGGAIRLWRGWLDGKPLPRLAELNKTGECSRVTVTEGIEDGLTVALTNPERRILVAIAVANIGFLELPEAIDRVEICAQNDPGGSAAAGGLDRVVGRLLRARKIVELRHVPPAYKDFNDWYRALSHGEAAG